MDQSKGVEMSRRANLLKRIGYAAQAAVCTPWGYKPAVVELMPPHVRFPGGLRSRHG